MNQITAERPALRDLQSLHRGAEAAVSRNGIKESSINPLRYSAEPRPRVLPSAAGARSPADQILDGLLMSWHEWRRGYQIARGFSSSDSTCQDYRAPTHWDWKNGASQERVESEIMRGVDRSIARVANTPRRWRSALEFEALNLATGAAVWSSKALPQDAGELEVLRLEARNMVVRELEREGVMTW